MSAIVAPWPSGPHRRRNALTGEHVLVSPHRATRPWHGAVEPVAVAARPAHDPACHLCPGATRAGGTRNPAYTGPWVFDNDFAALLPGTADAPVHDGLLVAEPETGVCRVICFSPRHDLALADLGAAAIRAVIDLWADQYAELGARPDVGHVQIFENRGEVMGCSNPHPHGQIWAQRSVPREVAAETAQQAAYHARHGRSLLADYVAQELARDERVVFADAHMVALVPFWATWPYETLLLPRRAVRDLTALDDCERDALAAALGRLAAVYDAVFGVPFPYSAGIHQAPTDGAPHPEWHLHFHFHPPLLRSATVKKFMVGYEMLGEPQRDITPE
ncbi:MAG: UDP-glucose--hexose-1-phosphate uridylyltransferase, partial [Gemmatimonadaceae bacterium]|nr:UDP-glucose--hexose-1-phosphate uridylyltransferase [Gemmatimonadaceae bacterium]